MKTRFAAALIVSRRRRRFRLCYGPSEATLRLTPVVLPLDKMRHLASETADDNAQVCLPCFVFVEHATSRWTNSSNSV